jgi:hypothetical protein
MTAPLLFLHHHAKRRSDGRPLSLVTIGVNVTPVVMNGVTGA